MTKLMTKTGLTALMLFLALLASGAAQILSAQDARIVFSGEQYREHMLWVDEEFTFDFDATSDEGTVRYELELTPMSPVGMTIDEETGVVSWTPQYEGMFEMTVKAYIQENPDIYNYAYGFLIVRDRANFNLCATISGRVTYDETNDAAPAYIAVIPANWEDDQWGGPIYPDMFVQTDDQGYYELEVPEGEWLVAVMGEGVAMEWFENAEMPENATVVNIECDETYTANFSVAEGFLLGFFNYLDKTIYETGEEFSFVPEMYNPREFTLSFELINAPADMTIDQYTGAVAWIAGEPGNYDFIIRATAVGREQVFADMPISLLVVDELPERCAYISGTIVDQNGDPVANAYVQAYSTEMYDGYYFPEMEAFYAEAQTDANGNYELYLAESSYILVAYTLFGMPVFYENTNDFTQATQIELTCGQTFVANMTLETYPEPEIHTISGRVVSEETGEPVSAYVLFMLAERNDDFDRFGKCFGSAMTDENGYYSYEGYFFGMNLIAVAYPENPEYMLEYYDNASDWASAAVLATDRDWENNDFSLPSYPEFDNSLHGIVRDENGNGIQANVVAWLIEPFDYFPGGYACPTVATDPDNEGEFEFTKLFPGRYILFALPYSDEVVPGFYVEGEIASLDYEYATVISIDADDNLTTNHEIILPVRGQVEGLVKLEGTVTGSESTTKVVNGQHVTSNTLQGVVVAAYDQSGKVIDYATTDADGKYILEGMSAGLLTVKASKQGYETFNSNLPVAQSQDKVNKDIFMQKHIVSGVETGKANINSVTTSPNPATNEVKIEFGASAQDMKIKVANAAGKIVIEKQILAVEGNNSITLDVTNLPSGTYYAIIGGKSVILNGSFNVVR